VSCVACLYTPAKHRLIGRRLSLWLAILGGSRRWDGHYGLGDDDAYEQDLSSFDHPSRGPAESGDAREMESRSRRMDWESKGRRAHEELVTRELNYTTVAPCLMCDPESFQ
jgi:hypothetical protein